jgi:hypothetical protein
VLTRAPEGTPAARLEERAELAVLEAGEQDPLEEVDEAEFEFSVELAASLAAAAAAAAEVAKLRERVRELESWLEIAAEWRRVEYTQARRLALMRATQRDARYSFVLSLPLLLLVLYGAGLVLLVSWLLTGH